MGDLVKKMKDMNTYNDYKEEITYFIYKTCAMVLNYILTLEKENINSNLFKDLHDFFFELVDCDYQDNKYVQQISREDRLAAEINNIDYTQLVSICLG